MSECHSMSITAQLDKKSVIIYTTDNLKCTFCVAVYKQDKIAVAFQVSGVQIKKDNAEALLAINEHNLISSEYRVAYDFNSSELIAFGLSGHAAKDVKIDTIRMMSDEIISLATKLLRLSESHSKNETF